MIGSITRRGAKGVLAGLAVGATLLLTACNGGEEAADPNRIVFAVLPAESQASSEPLWAPLIDDLREETGLEVELRFVANYTLLVEAMRAGQVQVAWISALPALDAVNRANGQVIGRIMNSEGETHYRSVLITRRGSGITLERVMACEGDISFGMGDARSTSGTLAPMAFLFGPVDSYGYDPALDSCSARPMSIRPNASAKSATPITRPMRWPSPTASSTSPPTMTSACCSPRGRTRARRKTSKLSGGARRSLRAPSSSATTSIRRRSSASAASS